MERLNSVAQKLQRDTRAEQTKAVERELGLSTEPGAASRSPELIKNVFQKLKQMFGGEQPAAQPAEGGVIPPTPVIGGGGG